MKFKIKKILFLLLLTLIFGCGGTRNITYDRDKILKKYSNNYEIFVDEKKVNLNNIFLDKDNIRNVQVDKKSKMLKITQLKQNELVKLNNFSDSIKKFFKHNGLIVIDGVPYRKADVSKMVFDPNAIKSYIIIKATDLAKKSNISMCNGADLLIITTK